MDFLNRTEQPSAGRRPEQRPSEGPGSARFDNRQDFQANRSDARDNRQGSVSDRRDNRQDSVSDRRDNLSDNRADRRDNMQQRVDNRHDRREQVHDQLRDNHPRYDFWKDNPVAARALWTRPYRRPTWVAVGAWFPAWGWSQPVVYDYGDNIYVEGDTVYYGDDPVGTTDEYIQQAYTIAQSAPDQVQGTEWMQLGVFALIQDGEASGPPPTFFVQLAVNKEGIIAGTYHNSNSNKSQEIEGAVDKDSQRSAWTVGGDAWPVMETGIVNLTKDEVPVLLHFESGQTQQWLMIRMEDPESGGQN